MDCKATMWKTLGYIDRVVCKGFCEFCMFLKFIE